RWQLALPQAFQRGEMFERKVKEPAYGTLIQLLRDKVRFPLESVRIENLKSRAPRNTEGLRQRASETKRLLSQAQDWRHRTCRPLRLGASGRDALHAHNRGNRPGDPKTIGLAQAVRSIVDYLAENHLSDVVLVGHSYGGMIVTGVADCVPERIRRLVYWNAFV